MARRLYVPTLRTGDFPLPADQAHHARDVLRLRERDPVELFDDLGFTATAEILSISPDSVVVRVTNLSGGAGDSGFTPAGVVHVAAAVPKGDRADWMIEKLTEIGVTTFTPLICKRSVVVPEGKNKLDRWRRIAVEAAKQSARTGMLQVGETVELETLVKQKVAQSEKTLILAPGATFSLSQAIGDAGETPVTLLIGPEGGWTDDELSLADAARLTRASLTRSILRIETAAVVAAAIALCRSGATSTKHPSLGRE